MKPVKLSKLKQHPRLVEFMRDALKEAESGKLRSISIVVVWEDGESNFMTAIGKGDIPNIVCELEILKQHLINSLCE